MKQFREVVNRATRAEEDEMFLLTMMTKKVDEMIQFLVRLTNLPSHAQIKPQTSDQGGVVVIDPES